MKLITAFLNKSLSGVLLPMMILSAMFSGSVFSDSKLSEVEQSIRNSLNTSGLDIKIASVQRSEIKGLYAVSIGEGSTLYFSESGGHFILGDLFRVKPNGLVNVDDLRRNDQRRDRINSIAVSDMIVFSPEGKTRAVVNVFTDVDCFYCQKLHREVPALNKMGVEVRYLAYPRAGIDSDSYNKIATAWCADNPQDAITRLKKGEQLSGEVCVPNPVADHFLLGQQIGVRGTPALVLETGEMLPGYIPAAELGFRLGIN